MNSMKIIMVDGQHWIVKGDRDPDGNYLWYEGPYETRKEAQDEKARLQRKPIYKQLGWCLVLVMLMQACALQPAPITTLDVRQAMANGASAQVILTDIDMRCQALNKKRRNFNTAIYATLWAPVALAGPIFLCQLPARKKTKAELKLMQEKRLEVENGLRR